MLLDNQHLNAALTRLVSAARSGNRAKRRLARKLATMSPQQLQHVDPGTFARLGPEGLKLFAAASRTFRSVAAAPQPIKARRTESAYNELRRRWHFAHPLIKCLMIAMLIGFCGAAAAGLVEAITTAIDHRPKETINGWPTCVRLDHASDGCIYRASSNRLTLAQIEAMTGLSSEIVIAWNTHLDFRFGLSPGTLILIPHRLKQ